MADTTDTRLTFAEASIMAHFPDDVRGAEKDIIARLISDILAAGHRISVYDGEEYAVKFSNDPAAIGQEIAATDETVLRVRRDNADKTQIGAVFLVHGNGSDVISDMTDNEEMVALTKGASNLAEYLNNTVGA